MAKGISHSADTALIQGAKDAYKDYTAESLSGFDTLGEVGMQISQQALEKIELRKHDSGPYHKTLSDFFTDKEEVFDKTGKKQYILTKDEAEDYSDSDIQKSFNEDDEE